MDRPIAVSACVRASIDDLCDVLLDDPASAFAPETSGPARRSPVLRTTLKVDLPDGGSVSQVVELELGLLKRENGMAALPVAWHATARHRPLPVFRGVLELRPLSASSETAVVLDGVYRPPLRVLGAFGDGLVGHRIARASLKRLVDEVAQRLDAEVDHRTASGGYHPAPAPERLGLPGNL